MKAFFESPLPAERVSRLLTVRRDELLPAARVRELLGVTASQPSPVATRASRRPNGTAKAQLEAMPTGAQFRAADRQERANWLQHARLLGFVVESEKQPDGTYLMRKLASVADAQKRRRGQPKKGKGVPRV